MASLKKWTVKHLRDLARKHLGKGHSRLKTRDELLAALRSVVPGLDGAPEAPEEAAGPATVESKSTTRSAGPVAARGASVPGATKEPRAEVAGETVRIDRGAGATSATRAAGSDRSGPARAPERAASQDGRGDLPAPDATPIPLPRPDQPADVAAAAEPLVEGFFVARVQGADEARRHHLTLEAGAGPRESGQDQPAHPEALEPLPHSYGTDKIVLCARDPHTAWVHWDLRAQTRDAAFEGLTAPRVLLRVLREGHEVQRLDAALESRSFYLYGLEPGLHYRVELHAIGADGTSRRIAKASNTIQLPADTVSADRSVRMMRVPWGLPLNRLREGVHRGEVTIESPPSPPPTLIVHEHWIPGPTSGSWQLERWQEQLELAPQPLDVLPPPPLPGGGFGSSSWLLSGSSDWLVNSSATDRRHRANHPGEGA